MLDAHSSTGEIIPDAGRTMHESIRLIFFIIHQYTVHFTFFISTHLIWMFSNEKSRDVILDDWEIGLVVVVVVVVVVDIIVDKTINCCGPHIGIE